MCIMTKFMGCADKPGQKQNFPCGVIERDKYIVENKKISLKTQSDSQK